jgi:prepilin-type N-terminal cleavage/methylation domain-containing protein
MGMRKLQQGFTLVEIAIVLVIIGLLLGGILKGQEMITQAKIKNVIADMSGVSAAMYGYQDRYRALPGDDKGAATRWTTGVAAANGDGVIEGTYTAASPAETAEYWRHLRLAGFVGGTGAEQPFNAVSGKMGVQTGDGTDATPGPVLGSAAVVGPPAIPAIPGVTSLMMCSANLPDKIAISVDAQMDDGIGTAGSVRAIRQSQPNAAVTGDAQTYAEDGVSTYVVCRQM